MDFVQGIKNRLEKIIFDGIAVVLPTALIAIPISSQVGWWKFHDIPFVLYDLSFYKAGLYILLVVFLSLVWVGIGEGIQKYIVWVTRNRQWWMGAVEVFVGIAVYNFWTCLLLGFIIIATMPNHANIAYLLYYLGGMAAFGVLYAIYIIGRDLKSGGWIWGGGFKEAVSIFKSQKLSDRNKNGNFASNLIYISLLVVGFSFSCGVWLAALSNKYIDKSSGLMMVAVVEDKAILKSAKGRDKEIFLVKEIADVELVKVKRDKNSL